MVEFHLNRSLHQIEKVAFDFTNSFVRVINKLESPIFIVNMSRDAVLLVM